LKVAAERSDYRALVLHILQEGRSGDLLLLGGPWLRAPVEYYNQARIPIVELPFQPTLVETDAEAVLGAVASVPRRLWVISPSGPGGERLGDARGWLARRFYPSSVRSSGAVDLIAYATEPAMRTGESRAVFNDTIEIPEIALPAASVPRDLPIPVRLSWRSRERINTNLGVVVEVVDGSRVVARHEGEPLGGTRPSVSWEMGETIVDRIAVLIPENVSTGSYSVRIAVTDLASRARWRLADGRDSLDLGRVQVSSSSRPSL
jgi:hypothetical protein